jgi:hypothetical protein
MLDVVTVSGNRSFLQLSPEKKSLRSNSFSGSNRCFFAKVSAKWRKDRFEVPTNVWLHVRVV